MLMHPAIADFIHACGEGGLRAALLGLLPELARLYWYTVEFYRKRVRHAQRLAQPHPL